MTNGPVSFDKAERIRWVGDPVAVFGYQQPALVRTTQGVFLFHTPTFAAHPAAYNYRRVDNAFGAAPTFGDPIEFTTFGVTHVTRPIHVGADGTFSCRGPGGTGVLGRPGRIYDHPVYVAPDGSGFYIPQYNREALSFEIRFATSLSPEPAFSGGVATIPSRLDHGLYGAVLDDGSLFLASVPGWDAKKPFVTKFFRVERDGTGRAVGELKLPTQGTDVDVVRCSGGAWLTLFHRGRRLAYRVDDTGRVIHGPLDLQKGAFAQSIYAGADRFLIAHNFREGVSLLMWDGSKVVESTSFVGAGGVLTRGMSVVESPDGSTLLVAFDVPARDPRGHPSNEIRLMRAELAAGDPALDPPFSDPPSDRS